MADAQPSSPPRAPTAAAATTAAPNPADHDARAAATAVVHASLSKRLRVTLTDDRIIEGTLECFDNSGNMILSGASNVSHDRAYRIGNVLVPGPVATRVMRARPAPPVSPQSATDVKRGLRKLSLGDEKDALAHR